MKTTRHVDAIIDLQEPIFFGRDPEAIRRYVRKRLVDAGFDLDRKVHSSRVHSALSKSLANAMHYWQDVDVDSEKTEEEETP